MFKNLFAWLKAKLRPNEALEKNSSIISDEYMQYKKSKLVAQRREEYEDAIREYGSDPNAKNYLIILKYRLKSAEEISNEFQFIQEVTRLSFSFP